ncbi:MULTISPECIES: hypothetical protein [unclassified Rhizobium]|uniref:hypothetical protein n=1 Tax=unclassified Rhizobium TaxID=2613769 RepID=UPI0007149D12|nr:MULTISPECIES: hypothetical protein [unclassified Rhizobium]KQS96655.1 hypothetical protein ASG50_06365 [Rhizobium sp. Leaf386]KQT06495.1 hypothetical protein ASG42_02610 [Rhizobium sp. Leaf391]KQT92566.1 hypothetical protein ASG68_17365 [Rhizobium sp. Leaf453]
MSDEAHQATMIAEELLLLRKAIRFTQKEMSDAMGLGINEYDALESGASRLRKIHQLAAERVAFARGADLNDPSAVPGSMLLEAYKVAKAFDSKRGGH